ncbi:MAG: hypothetical protein PV340_01225 [Wolbachia sp.]|nr:hypothetical protein [Wolbachia sp.]MDD9336594.1 hypothetical protein [Wolbachia sp.]
MKRQFIRVACEYLKEHGFNEKFDQEQYSESYFSKSLTGIKLMPIFGELDNLIPCAEMKPTSIFNKINDSIKLNNLVPCIG